MKLYIYVHVTYKQRATMSHENLQKNVNLLTVVDSNVNKLKGRSSNNISIV